MWTNYIKQLKAQYFDTLHKSNLPQWKKDIILTNKHLHILKVEKENEDLWREAREKTLEGVIKHWKDKNKINY